MTESLRTRAGLKLHVCHVARILGAPERTIRYWAQTGRLRARRDKVKVWLFEPWDVASFELQRRAAGG